MERTVAACLRYPKKLGFFPLSHALLAACFALPLPTCRNDPILPLLILASDFWRPLCTAPPASFVHPRFPPRPPIRPPTNTHLPPGPAAPQVLEGHTGRVTIVVFSPDGTMLASGSWDEAVRLWAVATGELRQV